MATASTAARSAPRKGAVPAVSKDDTGLEMNGFDRFKLVGLFYTLLTQFLFGGEVNGRTQGDDTVDIHLPNSGGIEVKGRSSRDPLHVFADQMFRHWMAYRQCLYALWTYSNGNNSGPRQFEQATPTRKSITKFLARKTTSVWVVDLEILNAIQEVIGTDRARRFNRNSETIKLSRRYLRRLLNNPAAARTELGLRPRKLRAWTLEVETVFHGNPMQFRVYLLLPYGRYRKLVRALHRQCKVTFLKSSR